MSKTGPMTYGRRYMNYCAQNGGGVRLTVRQDRQLRRMDRRDQAARGLLKPPVQVFTGRCGQACKAHREVCLLNGHGRRTPHRCSLCPWPADKRMVRRGSR